jgi:hypothetical protein
VQLQQSRILMVHAAPSPGHRKDARRPFSVPPPASSRALSHQRQRDDAAMLPSPAPRPAMPSATLPLQQPPLAGSPAFQLSSSKFSSRSSRAKTCLLFSNILPWQLKNSRLQSSKSGSSKLPDCSHAKVEPDSFSSRSCCSSSATASYGAGGHNKAAYPRSAGRRTAECTGFAGF